MSEEQTHNLDGRSFEERVFLRFDAMDARFDAMEGRADAMERRFEYRLDAVENRLERLEVQAEKRSLETKPIWEQTLAEIREVSQGVAEVDRKFDVLTEDVMKVRLEQRHIRHRVEHLESKKRP